MTRLCLNMIVRNEADKIERCLASARPYITNVAILDTGSTDGTIDKIKAFFKDTLIEVIVGTGTFENFSQARNDALALARGYQFAVQYDYLLLMDADMELVVSDPHAFDDLENERAIQIFQKGGSLVYANTRLLRADQTCVYRSVTHEYLDIEAPGILENVAFVDHADGSNRPGKLKRDIDLLTRDLRTNPENARSWFYLANSYKDNGQWKRAAKAYEKRIELGGYEEEVWQSIVNRAHCLKDAGNEAEFVKGLLDAYARRPSRVEPLYDLARFYRDKPNHQAVSTIFSEAGMTIPIPNDSLFVNHYAYDYGCRDEFAITAFYDGKKRNRAFTISDQIALDPKAGTYSHWLSRSNQFHYLQPLSTFLPSFVARPLPNPASNGYTPLNPCVTMFQDRLHVLVRTVNYRMDAQGRYLITAGDGSITNDNPIDTQNYLLQLDDKLSVATTQHLFDEPIEPKFTLVRGYEDMRIFEWRAGLWFSATVRDRIASGVPQQVLGGIEPDGRTIFHRALSDGTFCEKNWMPLVVDDKLRFAYRLDRFVDQHGREILKTTTGLDVGHIAGGSQVIPFKSGYLCLVHEARGRPDGDPRRYYSHRFAWFDNQLVLRKLTRPFCFNDKQIEFAAGLCWHPDDQRLVISYGLRDEEAVLATVNAEEMNHWLWHE